ncbi:MAG: quinoprotein dehydrogenase-associated SoxYZ-like carrier [Janthinobacterium lividum]
MKRSALLALLPALVLSVALPRGARAEDEAERDTRWTDLSHAIFGDRVVEDGAGVVTLQAPPRALDAALVPVTIQLSGTRPVKAVYLVIDDNPSPLAATFTFGALADPGEIKLRVRVNQYTRMQAVAETTDGKLYMTQDFVKAAGGCSAPAGSNDEDALRVMGQMKLRLLTEFAPGKPLTAQLLIRHPNFNGMQMDQVTRLMTPARFLDRTDITYDGKPVMQVASDISLSTDPAITFSFVPPGPGKLDVIAHDSKGTTFEHGFDVPAQGT